MVKLINQGKKYFIQNNDINSIEAVIDRLNKARATLQKAVKAVNDANKKLFEKKIECWEHNMKSSKET